MKCNGNPDIILTAEGSCWKCESDLPTYQDPALIQQPHPKAPMSLEEREFILGVICSEAQNLIDTAAMTKSAITAEINNSCVDK